MITIFTIPKAFKGFIGTIQKNAVLSWKKLRPECEIILFGDDEGVAEFTKEFNCLHISEVRKNEYGTPLISDVFERAEKTAKNKVLVYVNADIILMQNFLEAVSKIEFDKFLMVGRRYDLDIKKEIYYQNTDWEKLIREKIKKEGALHGYSGIDYLIFSKGMWRNIPEFAIGRTAWDNWFLHRAWIKNYPLIDATKMITIIHQNHSYSHIKGGKKNYKLKEVSENLKLAGGGKNLLTIRDANFVLTPIGLEKPKINLCRIISFPFRYFGKVSFFFKIFLFPGWLIMILFRKLRRLFN